MYGRKDIYNSPASYGAYTGSGMSPEDNWDYFDAIYGDDEEYGAEQYGSILRTLGLTGLGIAGTDKDYFEKANRLLGKLRTAFTTGKDREKIRKWANKFVKAVNKWVGKLAKKGGEPADLSDEFKAWQAYAADGDEGPLNDFYNKEASDTDDDDGSSESSESSDEGTGPYDYSVTGTHRGGLEDVALLPPPRRRRGPPPPPPPRRWHGRGGPPPRRLGGPLRPGGDPGGGPPARRMGAPMRPGGRMQMAPQFRGDAYGGDHNISADSYLPLRGGSNHIDIADILEDDDYEDINYEEALEHANLLASPEPFMKPLGRPSQPTAPAAGPVDLEAIAEEVYGAIQGQIRKAKRRIEKLQNMRGKSRGELLGTSQDSLAQQISDAKWELSTLAGLGKVAGHSLDDLNLDDLPENEG